MSNDNPLADMKALIITGGIWQVASIKDNPEVTLDQWTVRQVMPAGTLHFVGYHHAYREGRVSSAIIRFDPEAMRGVTKSGRIYQLRGDTGFNSDAEYVWDRWCGIPGQGVESWTVVDIEDQETFSKV